MCVGVGVGVGVGIYEFVFMYIRTYLCEATVVFLE